MTDRSTAAEASGKPEYKDIQFEPVWQMQPPFIERVKSKVKKGSGSAWHGEASRRVEKLLKKHPHVPLLVNFFHHAVEIENAIQQSRNPLVIFVHGHDIHWCLHPPDYKDRCLQLANRGVIAANSTYTRDLLIETGFPHRCVEISHFGIPIKTEKRQPGSQKQLNILYLGRLIELKGPDLTIQAFKLALDSGLNATLVIAGDGPLRKRCEDLVRRLSLQKHVKMLGAVSPEEGVKLRAKADIFTAHNQRDTSGRAETFGVSILEAMANGIPVVTGDQGGHRDMIASGSNGFLFKSGDIEHHAAHLLRLAANATTRIEIGNAARETVRTKFSVNQELRTIKRVIALASTGQTKNLTEQR